MTPEEICEICKDYKIKNYTMNDDLSIDVDGNVYLYNKGFKELPLKFGNVTGSFNCSYNKLTTLKGAPIKVGRHFFCSANDLTSLDGAPSSVGENFDCDMNELISLEGGPSSVYGKFYCYGNPLESFKGIPLNISNEYLYLPKGFTYSDYLSYCRDIKFKKVLSL